MNWFTNFCGLQYHDELPPSWLKQIFVELINFEGLNQFKNNLAKNEFKKMHYMSTTMKENLLVKTK